MTVFLEPIYIELKELRTYLIKIGQSRRKGSILITKQNEANSLYKKYESWLLDFKEKVSRKQINTGDIQLIEELCKKIAGVYNQITDLCQKNVEKSCQSTMD